MASNSADAIHLVTRAVAGASVLSNVPTDVLMQWADRRVKDENRFVCVLLDIETGLFSFPDGKYVRYMIGE